MQQQNIRAGDLARRLCAQPDKTGDREYRVPCPAHNGEGKNLAITDKDGTVKLFCHSNECTQADIWGAIESRFPELKENGAVRSHGGKADIFACPECGHGVTPRPLQTIKHQSEKGWKWPAFMRLSCVCGASYGSLHNALISKRGKVFQAYAYDTKEGSTVHATRIDKDGQGKTTRLKGKASERYISLLGGNGGNGPYYRHTRGRESGGGIV